jgi:putative flippase GtrA
MRRSKFTVLSAYVLIAIVSTVLNLAAQSLVVRYFDIRYVIELSILIGTVVGMPPRYVLEKKYVFFFVSNDIKHDSKLFFFYSFYGVFTTLIFWSVEYMFHIYFAADFMRYVGGLVGLSIGFYLKYQIDKKYVFNSKD